MKRLIKINCALLLGILFSCKVEHASPPNEAVKNISGSWTITDATRNGTDLTSGFNFSQFRIVFSDSTYTIDSLVPFVVSHNGKWAFNDPQYPFSIIFTQTDSPSVSTPFLFPVVNGVRNIVLTFSPGCPSNTYQYTLQKAN
jgi:hypothetical protein